MVSTFEAESELIIFVLVKRKINQGSYTVKDFKLYRMYSSATYKYKHNFSTSQIIDDF